MLDQRVFKTGQLCGAIGLIALGSATSVQAVNLLSNPGFEAPATPLAEDTVATGWTFFGTAKRANFQNHTVPGSRSIWFRTFEPLDSGVYQNVPVTVGANYTLTAQEYFETNY